MTTPVKRGFVPYQELVGKMRELGNQVFDQDEIEHLMGRPVTRENGRAIIHRMVKRGELVRIANGLFALPDAHVPLGIRLHWISSAWNWHIGGRSALAAHGFGPPLPQPVLQVVVDGYRYRKPLSPEITVHFMQRPVRVHGEPVEMDLPVLGSVGVAEPETLLLDGLQSPNDYGGFLELCRFIHFRRGKWDGAKLVVRAKAWQSPSIERRIGALMTLANDPCVPALEQLREQRYTYLTRMDPSGEPSRGRHFAEWGVRMNLDVDAVVAALTGNEAVPALNSSAV